MTGLCLSSRVVLLTALSCLLGCALAGCKKDGDCEAVDDFSGTWEGTYSTNKVMNAEVTLELDDDGSRIVGSYASEDVSGEVEGLQTGSQVSFEITQTGSCPGHFTGTASGCSDTLTLTIEGNDECLGDHQGSGTLTREPTSETCEYADDGECDEPEGTGLCANGTDPVDCGDAPGSGNCEYSNDGQCDEPEGTGLCASGTDLLDCQNIVGPSICRFTGDGICDEPQGSGACPAGSDRLDCGPVGPSPICRFTGDGVCDEPEGSGACPDGTDVVDCSTNVPVPTPCASTNNGECDEPEGSGLCPEGSDSADCSAVACGSLVCPSAIPPVAGIPTIAGCCIDGTTCGIAFAGGECVEYSAPEPGTCPNIESVIGGLNFPSCCRPDGLCGVDLSQSGLGIEGCADASGMFALVGTIAPVECGEGPVGDAGP